MISKYKFSNFRSFSDVNEFEMIASPTKVRNRFSDNFVSSDTGIKPVKTSVVVGENAGGKSNFISSLNYLKSLFRENQVIRAIKSNVNINNADLTRLDNPSNSQFFELQVIIDNKIYDYCLQIDFVGIVKEMLSVRNKRTSASLTITSVERVKCVMSEEKNETINKVHNYNVKYNIYVDLPNKLSEVVNSEFQEHNPIGLFTSKIALLGNQYAKIFCSWMNEVLYAEPILVSYDLQRDYLREDDDIRIIKDKRFIDILKMVDFSIINLDIDDEKPFLKTKIIRNKKDETPYFTDVREDSTGVREFFAWAVQIFRVVYEDKIVFADEMDRVLNPVLSDRVIGYINGMDHNGQFIITTHNALHLDLTKLMKEQIYIITKNNDTLNSELYSLADFPEIRYETTKVYELYMKGVLGGTMNE